MHGLSAAAVLFATAVLARAGEISFNRDVRPILSDNCYYCHGFDAKHREGNRRLDSFKGATADNDGVRAVVPEDLSASDVWERLVTTDEDDVMPPPKTHKTVTAAQKEIIRQWILQGAKYEDHWAFIPPAAVEPPAVKQTAWPRGVLDRFILARLEKESVQPSPEADREMLIRRVTLDLIGLPPTPAEVRSFRDDKSATAYEEVVERLLNSKRYGERMAVDWLDASRYADTHGFNNDAARSMWRWRDWVIDSFNDNLPYDQFITAQLAGDLLPQATLEQRLATGFCRSHVINSEGGIIPEEYRVEYVADRVRTTSLSWLGLTMECARCHDHKFDPVTQRDYYSLFSFFNNVPESGEDGRRANAAPIMSAPTREQQAESKAQRDELAALEKRMSAMQAAWKPKDANKAAAAAEAPTKNMVMHLDCDHAEPQKDIFNFAGAAPELVDGIAGKAWRFTGARLVEFEKNFFFTGKLKTFGLWLRPDADNPRDVALLSNASYQGDPGRDDYASGEDYRLVEGEIEIRVIQMFPAYSLRMRTIGAGIAGGEWRHLAVIIGDDNLSQTTQVFIDGREIATRVLSDFGSRNKQKALFGLGADRSKQAPGFRGAMDEMRVYEQPLNDAQVIALFESAAVPCADRQKTAGLATERELRWLSEARQRNDDAAFAKLSDECRSLWTKHLRYEKTFPNVMVMEEMPAPRRAFVLKRGVYDAHGDEVTAKAPELFAPWPQDAPANRLGLAQWFTQPQHPLTARVVVNRFWAQFFGIGLVKTLEDFGSQGDYPSHAELLDWLARRFVDSGWDVKVLVRMMVLSATYRQSSQVTPEMVAHDPENRLLARAPRLRLQAEFLRDQALALGGLLTEKIGGPSVYPTQPEGFYNGVIVDAAYPGTKWLTSKGDDLYRRSLYTFWKRSALHPVMGTFDAPARETCTVRRSRTNTPLQALVLMNEPGFVQAACALGQRMEKEGGATDESKLHWGFQLATGRAPAAAEFAELQRALADARQSADEAPFATVGSILLNLDELVTRE